MRAPAITALSARARRALAPWVLTLATAVPTAAFALTLPQLLQMPLERLLQLRIDSPSATPALPRPRS
jgi:hypothetical protein